MIESKQIKERITGEIERWTKYTKVNQVLREGDIPDLVRSIMGQIYHVHLCCGHMVKTVEEGVHLSYEESDGSVVQGVYCRDCAEVYKEKLQAKEVK